MRPWMGVGLTAFVCLCPCRAPAAPSAAIVFKDLKVADMQRDTAFLRDQSPLYNSDKIRGPVFLAYSVEDTQLPYSDAEELKKALERAHKSVVLLAKNQEPHLFDKEQDKIDLFTNIEPFLKGCNPSQ